MTLPPKLSHPAFLQLIDAMEGKLTRMEESPAVAFPFQVGTTALKGGYVFYLDGNAQYTGRSNDVPKRLKQHSLVGSGYRSAAFAMRIAKRQLGLPRTYHLSRDHNDHPLNDPRLPDAFEAAKAKIRNMSVRVIEENDPTRQALLEIYIATRLGCPYNDFDNH